MILVRAMPRNREVRYGVEKVGDQAIANSSMTDITGWKMEEATQTSGLPVASTGFNLRPLTPLSYVYAQVSIGRTTSPIEFNVGQTIQIGGVDAVVGTSQVYPTSEPDGKTFGLLSPEPIPSGMAGLEVKSRVVTNFPSGSVLKGGPNTLLRIVEKRGDAYKGATTFTGSGAVNVWQPVSGDWSIPLASGFQADPSGLFLVATEARKSVVLAATVRSKASGLGVAHVLRIRVESKVVVTSGVLGSSTAERTTNIYGSTDIAVGDKVYLEAAKTTSNGGVQLQVLPGTGTDQTRLHIY
ncbi:hypothetical protein SEA_CHEWYVIII_35 [Rhodococcus phage ChewyVIII]|uniref:Uncharacterized protein n=1 Tax=Rhodococcus phage ChewyVIII TaxID=1887657 RepID=A0A1C9EI64_9CAUD|nr:hypothetical protein QEH30_gp35 [Rhodococcus phage ChewyVIII]AON97457.1 hypothetical protein SEA_CHEWYVIII_35 [Rhodococcus phage ChewyVIII]